MIVKPSGGGKAKPFGHKRYQASNNSLFEAYFANRAPSQNIILFNYIQYHFGNYAL